MSDVQKSTTALAPAQEHSVAIDRFTVLTTRDGFSFKVRPVEPFDESALRALFTHVAEDDMLFRFLSPMKKVGDDMMHRLIDVDHARKEDYLAFSSDGKTIIASAVVAADERNACAEVAIAMHSDFKHRGVGWTLLEYVAQQARRKGIRKLQSIENRANREAIALEKDMGFAAKPYPGDASLTLLELDLTARA